MTETRDITERLLSRSWEDRHHRKYREEAAQEIRRLRKACRTAAEIIDRNLYHQREKVADAADILRSAIEPTD